MRLRSLLRERFGRVACGHGGGDPLLSRGGRVRSHIRPVQSRRDGMGGLVAVDLTEAVRWWRMAAKAGDAVAQNQLAMACYHGQGGLARDAAAAKKLWTESAAYGFDIAENNLAKYFP